MPLYDRRDSLPVIGSPISYKLSIRMMKRLITTPHTGFYLFFFFVLVHWQLLIAFQGSFK